MYYGDFNRYVARYQGVQYLVYKQRLHPLPKVHINETLEAVGVSLNQIHDISPSVFKRFTMGTPMPELWKKDNSADEIMRFTLSVNAFLQPSLFRNTSFLGHYINPSLLPFQGYTLMLTGLSWTLPGMNDGQAPSNTIQFRWVNQTDINEISADFRYLGIGTRIGNIADLVIAGQDPRVLMINSTSFMIIHTRQPFSRLPLLSGLTFLTFSGLNTSWTVTKRIDMILYGNSKAEKNWSPLLVPTYSSPSSSPATSEPHILFIQSINPLILVRIEELDPLASTTSARAIVVSQAPRAHYSYAFGELRGGTNAIALGHDRYLAFFHSVQTIPNSILKSYFMGAYTFRRLPTQKQEQDHQWRLEAISPVPMMEEWLYTGPWNPFNRNRRIDYCVFPMSLTVLPSKNKYSKAGSGSHNAGQYLTYNPHAVPQGYTNYPDPATARTNSTIHRVQVLLSFGRQDLQGFSTIFDLDDLLASLEPVVYCENKNGTDSGTDNSITEERNSQHNHYYHILREEYCHAK